MAGDLVTMALLTIAIEVPIAVFFGLRSSKELFVVVLINLITNPVLNYALWVNYQFFNFPVKPITMLMLEGLVVLVEWKLLMYSFSMAPKKLFLLSLTMNVCSYLVGMWLF